MDTMTEEPQDVMQYAVKEHQTLYWILLNGTKKDHQVLHACLRAAEVIDEVMDNHLLVRPEFDYDHYILTRDHALLEGMFAHYSRNAKLKILNPKFSL